MEERIVEEAVLTTTPTKAPWKANGNYKVSLKHSKQISHRKILICENYVLPQITIHYPGVAVGISVEMSQNEAFVGKKKAKIGLDKEDQFLKR